MTNLKFLCGARRIAARGAVFALTVLTTVAALGELDPRVCEDPRLGDLPQLSEGRLVPLSVYADGLATRLWSVEGCEGLSAERLYCYLSFGARSYLTDHLGCAFRLRLGPDGKKRVAVDEAIGQSQLKMRTIAALERDPEAVGREQTLSVLKSDLAATGRWVAIESGRDWRIFAPKGEWSRLESIKSQFEPSDLFKARERLSAWDRFCLKLEAGLMKPGLLLTLFLVSAGAAITAALCLRQPMFKHLGRAASGAVLLGSLAVLIGRIMVSSRAPVTNMFESILWFGFVALSSALVLAWKWREPRLVVVGHAAHGLSFAILLADPVLLDASLRPLVPALRSNLWLGTHVLTVTGAYAIFGLSWLIGNVALIRSSFGMGRVMEGDLEKRLRRWAELSRRILQGGVILLALGIFLGAVWADVSWGRFWGWDPKETWSLITLIAYLAILHGPYAGWFKPRFFHLLTVLGFLFVVMTWFGVNWIFAKGLHSYGFSSGGAGAVIAFCIVQLGVLTVTSLRQERSEDRGESYTGAVDTN